MRASPPANSWHMLTLRTGGGRVDGQGHPAERVGQVDEEGVGAVALDVVADAEHGPDGPEGVEDGAGAAVLPGDLGGPVPAGDLVVLDPVRPAPDLGAGQAEVGAGHAPRPGRVDASMVIGRPLRSLMRLA